MRDGRMAPRRRPLRSPCVLASRSARAAPTYASVAAWSWVPLRKVAARLAAETAAPLDPLIDALDGMRRAAASGHRKMLLDCDLEFHLKLCEAAENPFLLEHARRILLPFFAFVRMRVTASKQETSVWGKDLEAHQRIIDLIREGEGHIAEEYVRKAMDRFAKTAYDNWEKSDSSRPLKRPTR